MGQFPNTEPAELLSALGLCVSFGSRFALGPVQIELTVGRHLALLGPSGSGKSSLLRLLTGHAIPSEGSISIFGTIKNLADQIIAGFEGIKVVGQEADLPAFQRFGMSMKRELASIPDPEKQDRIHTISKTFNCAEFLDAKPEELSLGQRQRCALALAFAGRPSLVALDEPFSHQDAWQRQQLLEAVRQEALRVGTTLILCTHDWSEAAYLTKNAIFLLDGQVAYQGATISLRQVTLPEAQAFFGWISSDASGGWVRYRMGKRGLEGGRLFQVKECLAMADFYLLVGKEEGQPVWVKSSRKVAVGRWVSIYPIDKR